MTQKTNETYLELYTHTSRKENTQSFVSNDLVGCCCCCVSPLDATNFENGYPTTEKLVCSAVSKESVTTVRRAFRAQFEMEPLSQVKLCAKCTLGSCYILFAKCETHQILCC
jgi:hypothetical protein